MALQTTSPGMPRGAAGLSHPPLGEPLCYLQRVGQRIIADQLDFLEKFAELRPAVIHQRTQES